MSAPRQFAFDVVTRLREAGHVAYWAGGCVRDLLLNKQPKDYDVATDARPERVRELFGHRRTRAVGASFGVILVHGPGEAGDIEVATFRSEGPYLDGRRPDHVVFCSPEQDAQRRDFTINGMFYDPVDQRVMDFVGGQTDVQRKVVRAIGDPLERFREDKLRLLRAIRFAATLNFQLHPLTAHGVRQMAAEIKIVSAERIAQEWKRMLIDRNRISALTLAADTQLLEHVFPESRPMLGSAPEARSLWNAACRAVEALTSPGFELVLATWLNRTPGYSSKTARSLCLRLRLSNDEQERIVWLEANSESLTDARTFPLSRLKRLLAHPFIHDLLELVRARRMANDEETADVEFCENSLRDTPAEVLDPLPLISGDDLIRHGLQPGRQFKQILDTIRDAQLENRITTHDQALNLALEMTRVGDNPT